MKRALIVTALLAMGLLVASSFAAAQDAPATTSGGQVDHRRAGRRATSPSSKFQEYRDVPKGVSIPYVNLCVDGNAARLQPAGLQRPPDRPALHRLAEHVGGSACRSTTTRSRTTWATTGGRSSPNRPGRVGDERDAAPGPETASNHCRPRPDGAVLRRSARADLRRDEQRRPLEPAQARRRRARPRREAAVRPHPDLHARAQVGLSRGRAAATSRRPSSNVVECRSR